MICTTDCCGILTLTLVLATADWQYGPASQEHGTGS